MPEFHVICFAGYRADERPIRFGARDGPMAEVAEILSRWAEEGARCFKVKDGAGAAWVLRHDLGSDEWSAVRA
jgi:hypothetical protein